MTYVLPNRKAFSDSITRIFLKYREKRVEGEDESEDLCLRQGAKASRELFSYQKLVREYLLMETPYRGLLLYHGLGSGKTCSSIAVAESLMSNKKVFILLPASLRSNYLGEIRKCGDPIYAYEQYWEEKKITTPEDREAAKKFGLSDKFLDKQKRYFLTEAGKEPNYRTLAKEQQDGIGAQIDDLLNTRFQFINYNGISSANVDKILPPNEPHMFDDSVIIIDEAHNLIGNVVNDRANKKKLYDMMYSAKNTKIVALSGTPMVNRPNEIAVLLNLLKGPIERISVPLKNVLSWDESKMTGFFKAMIDVDTIEFNASKRTVMLTRNPPYFESVYNDKGDRIAVKYSKDLGFNPDIGGWVGSWKTKFETTFGGSELADPTKFAIENLECLPSKYEEFMPMFVDGLSVKNPLMFQRRIQGLVSYYKGADERLLPARLEEDKTLVKVPFSEEQYLRYLEVRWEEIQRESKKGRRQADLNEEMGSFRMTSRLACNYAIPSDLKYVPNENETEDMPADKSDILEKLKADPKRYLSDDALKIYSPKMLKMLNDLKENIGSKGKYKNQFVYSQYLTLEGLGVFGLILEANGFQKYKLVKQPGGGWIEDPEMKEDVPAYALFVGGEEEQRELYRQIFNEKYSDTFPQELKDSLEGKPKRLSILMASSAGAEGISLENVRNVSIMEPYWNPARIDQVIGRAMRICSHARLPKEDRNVVVRIYLSVFSKEQAGSAEGPNIVSIRRNDMTLKRYEGDTPQETFMTSDEFLWETAYEKSRIIKSISHLLKQAAVDCEIHRKLHSKEQPVIQCMRFDSNLMPDELGYKPAVATEERDVLYRRNVIQRTRTLQTVSVGGMAIIFDPQSGEVFDYIAFEDAKRLLKIGQRIAPGKIQFFTSTVS
jgi:hypothetical protein